MVMRSFTEIRDLVLQRPRTYRAAIAAAGDPHTLQSVLRAREEGIISPILVGDARLIRENLEKLGETVPERDILGRPDLAEAAAESVAAIREGRADLLVKGRLDTAILLRAVMNKETGLGTGRVMSHVTLFQVPSYHKLLCPVEGGVVPYPNLQQKKAIIENTVEVLHLLGYECPKVGVLACIEKVNPKMPETLDAAELKRMNQAGEITGCIVEGPIPYDCAIDRDIAALKGFESPCAGDCDILVAPNIHTGNIMGKMLSLTAHAPMAGVIAGARCPFALTSRGSSVEEKYWSIVLAAAVAPEEG